MEKLELSNGMLSMTEGRDVRSQQVSAKTAKHLVLIYVSKPDPLKTLCFHLHHFHTL